MVGGPKKFLEWLTSSPGILANASAGGAAHNSVPLVPQDSRCHGRKPTAAERSGSSLRGRPRWEHFANELLCADSAAARKISDSRRSLWYVALALKQMEFCGMNQKRTRACHGRQRPSARFQSDARVSVRARTGESEKVNANPGGKQVQTWHWS